MTSFVGAYDGLKILIHDYAGHPFQLGLSRELVYRGYDLVHAYAGGLLTPRGNFDPFDGMSIREVPMDPNYRRDKYRFLRRRAMEVRYGRVLCELIEEEQPSLVISGNCPTEPQLAAAECCHHYGVPFVSWIQDFYSLAVDRLASRKLPLVGGLVGKWYRCLERKTLQGSAGVVAITEDFLPMLRGYGVPEERTVVIPNWAPLDELPVGDKDNEWSRRNGLVGRFCFLYSGTLAMKHNPDLLLQLALRFRNDSGVVVVVVSEGPGADWLHARREEHGLSNMRILPFQDFESMPAVLASGDVLLAVLEPDAGVFSVPSKVLTYHCARRPMLAAIPSTNLAARIISRERSGLCVDPQDVVGFVDAGERLYREREFGRECGRNARAYAEKNFDVAAITDRFEGFLKQVIGGQPPGRKS